MKQKISDIINQLTNTPELKEFDDTMKKYKLGGYKKKISKLNLENTNVPTTLPELTRDKLLDYLQTTDKGSKLKYMIDNNEPTQKIVDELKGNVVKISNAYIQAMINADNGYTEEMTEMYENISDRCMNLGYNIPAVWIEALFKNDKLAFMSFCDLLERAERYKEQGVDDMVEYCMNRANDIVVSSIT